jgi:putative component of toxin-antitoxin plasmid stabilization module
MIEIRQNELYAQWFDSLRDRHARAVSMLVSVVYRSATLAT